MPLRRSIRNKNRSLNLRQRKISLEQVHNNVTNVDNTINVVTEVKDNNDDANESEFERYTESTEYNENEPSENIDNENDYIDSDDENYHVNSNDENYHVDSDNENYHVDSDIENNSVSDNEDEHKNLEDPESILENSSFSNSVFDGEFGPYFSSSTSALIFSWFTKHMITTHAYEDLVKILNHPNFDVKEVPTNIRYFKKNSRARLPLLTVKKYTIPISNMKTQSTSQPSREAYAISLFDILTKILSNPLLMSKMYNGPGIEVENKSEFWHGELWQQSPLFGEHSITINSVEYFTGDFVHISASNQLNCMRIISIVLHNNGLKLKLQRFLAFDELPAQFKTTDRYFNSNNKRWLLEEDKFIIVEPEVIICKTSVWLQDQNKPNYYSYTVSEILYKYQNKWKIRDFDLILNSDSSTVQKNLCSKFGLKNQKPVLDYLIRDRFLQTPQDIYHAIAGKILKLMDCTFNMFNSSGNNEFIKNWKLFEMPIKWHKLPNSITHRQSFMMSDRLRLAMVLPHILRRYLHISHLKNNSLIELQENLSVNINKIIDKLIQCWVIVAKCAKVCFSLSFSNDSYNILNNLLNQEIIILTKTFPQDFTYLSNLHINDGTSDSRYNNHLGNGYFQDNIFRSLLSSWYATSTTMPNNKEIVVDETVEPPDNCIYEIRLQTKWKLHQILQNNFETNMSIDGDIYYSLKTAYKEYFNFTEYLHNNKIVYFNYITYKVLNQKDDGTSIIQIHVGDIVELEEKLEGNSYAIIQAIFLHTYNNGKTYPFYFLKWFEKIEGRNGIDMMCQKYKICTERKKWHNIFPISFITSMPKVHFVHQCVNNCSVRNHDLSQPYLLNEFFYNAI
ncbi:unnamed protein product [Rhizophagus irregularis]|uniref:BAH domain-containing protein n=1 Tax=Rhizophagus irregularis TaxID=588596 RepID=A0A915ZE11_9GLOM|nr:unnamed protein product [Rhizophagus irregularis]